MKHLLFVILAIICLTSQTKAAKMSPQEQQDLIDFGMGLAMGLNLTDRVPDLINCVFANETQIAGSVKAVLDDFKALHIEDAISDLKQFAQIFAVGACGSAKTEGKKYVDDLMVGLADPVKVVEGDVRLFKAKSTVLQDVIQGTANCKAKSYYKCALFFSNIVSIFLGFS